MVAAADVLLPPPIDKAQRVSPLVVDRHGEWLHAFTTEDGRWRFAADLEQIDPLFIERLIAVEDKRFYAHWGVDPLAVARAGGSAIKSGQIVSGASTITMQASRLLEPRPRTFTSKMIEMLRAFQLERRLSKREILELYLTLAPYGGNLEGVRAASRFYFDKEPTRLTDAEQALLIALPQAPETRRPDRRSMTASAAREKILEKLVSLGAMSPQLAQEAAQSRLPSERHAPPRLAYHTAHRLSQSGRAGVIQSTLDLVLQSRAEILLQQYVKQFDDGATASMMIIENETRAVRASVGSSGLDADGGWMDLTRASRSPGSALKPFIYGLAFEDGFAGGDTVIDDMPRAFGDYAPENFDRGFRGEVRVREALQHSLNVPAVRALDRVGAGRFAALLKSAGVDLKTPRSTDNAYGLALALGGAGITAQELAVLYAGLGDGGEVKPLVWREDRVNDNASGYRLFSETTATRISAILAGAPSLEGRAPALLSQNAIEIAYKTGTSYGFRDAWAAGHGGDYTVVVWVGRADGAPRPGHTGRKTAAPLLFEAFDLLGRHKEMRDGVDMSADDNSALALARFEKPVEKTPPQIIFPRNGVEVYLGAQTHGFSLSARGGADEYRWYVNGDLVAQESTSGRSIWRPEQSGFYDIVVVDRAGQSARSKVRVSAG
ncbi:penicillin-binding protein 1C [Hyphococcus sp.]|uniref:penicillin-binding protein 1C n=1 Tax=Hyphococcus sp. TaxID=2038636 RepID=UPI003CCBE96A